MPSFISDEDCSWPPIREHEGNIVFDIHTDNHLQIEKIVTTIALPDRSEVEELSSDYAQSILDKVIIVIIIIMMK